MTNPAPNFERMRELFVWVVQDTDALCPLPERLKKFLDDPAAPEVADLYYHIEQASKVEHTGCRFCQQAISLLRGNSDEGAARRTAEQSFFETEEAAPPASEPAQPCPELPQLRSEFSEAYAKEYERLVAIVRKWQRLRELAEDLVADLAVEALRKIEAECFRPKTTWQQWLLWLTNKRVLDALRKDELMSLDAIMGTAEALQDWMPEAADLTLRQEKRNRQRVAISDVVRRFCRERERTAASLRKKELFEREMHDQSRQQMADEMGMNRSSVDVYARENFLRIAELLKEADPGGTLFNTFGGWAS